MANFWNACLWDADGQACWVGLDIHRSTRERNWCWDRCTQTRQHKFMSRHDQSQRSQGKSWSLWAGSPGSFGIFRISPHTWHCLTSVRKWCKTFIGRKILGIKNAVHGLVIDGIWTSNRYRIAVCLEYVRILRILLGKGSSSLPVCHCTSEVSLQKKRTQKRKHSPETSLPSLPVQERLWSVGNKWIET